MIEFTLVGNQEEKTGNPIPYHRQTQRSSFYNPSARRYHAWKDFIRQEYWLQTANKISSQKPFNSVFRGKVEFTIDFKSENHADPDNIAKGILDALFENDKHVDIATSHTCNNKQGKVIIKRRSLCFNRTIVV